MELSQFSRFAESIQEFCCKGCRKSFKCRKDLESHLNENHMGIKTNNAKQTNDTDNDDDESASYCPSMSSLNNTENQLSFCDDNGHVVKRIDDEPPTKKRKISNEINNGDLDVSILDDIELIVNVNTESISKWKQLLNGNPNNNNSLNRNSKRKKTKKNEKKIENRQKCSTCHTYDVSGELDQCESCKDLGMPFCSNCDHRLSYQDFKHWLNEHCKQNLNDKEISDFVPSFLVLCKTCFAFCQEFL